MKYKVIVSYEVEAVDAETAIQSLGPVTVHCVRLVYDPEYGDDRLCQCGHPYYRHFDTYDGMASVGCKYCSCDECDEFKEDIHGRRETPDET